MSPPETVPSLLSAERGGQGFDAPWQAEALALSIVLQDAGLVSGAEWAETLGRERSRPDLMQDGSDYYVSVIAALEAVLVRKGVATASEIAGLAASWRRAAQATPHGQPISLANDPDHDAG